MPSFYERQSKGYRCLLHAAHNVLGTDAMPTVETIEEARKMDTAKRGGGSGGFWDEGMFMQHLQRHCGADVELIKISGHSGNPKTKLEAFMEQYPDWKSKRYLLILSYDHKRKKKGSNEYPLDFIIIAGHAVALVDGHILDSDDDFNGKFYPLQEYPLNDTIITIYEVSRR